MWQTFFGELGVEVVVSTPTTQAMLTAGSSRVVTETCLPVKVFVGHVLSLVEKCDYVFIPAVRSVASKVYNCAKFLSLPDLTRAVIPESPPILDIDIDINLGKKRLCQAIDTLGKHFTRSTSDIKQAAMAAWQVYQDYLGLMEDHSLTPPRAIESISGTSEVEPEAPHRPDQATIAIIGHPYLLYDEHVNHRLIHRLEQAGSRVVTPEMLTAREIGSATTAMVGRAYWTYEGEVVGAGGRYLQNGADGVIGVMAFGCGPDSVMMNMVERRAAGLKTTSFMTITLEEHTAEAGIVTRLEAFLDMIERRRRRHSAVCA
jgi:predicted nucleotide-binding protein (sugar kinase/HSP70/actin superfamily)